LSRESLASTMLGSLRERLTGLGESMTSGMGEEEATHNAEPINLETGAHLLSHFQEGWRRLHEGAEQAARQAERGDKEVTNLYNNFDTQWKQVSQLSSLMGQLPEFNKEVEGVMASLGQLEATCQEVEIALLALEDTIDAREAQERQLESRFQLALDQERRRQELEELEQRLEQVYQRKVREKREAEEGKKREVQERLQAQFESDMASFRVSGSVSNRLEVPRRVDHEVSLESVELDEVGDEQEKLENFLNEDCPGLDPLPKD